MTYNTTRENKDLLQRHHDAPASLCVQLHHDHWTLNSGSKFLYTSPAAAFLDDIRAYRIPVDLLQLIDSANVPFYEGCLVVELQDFREPPATKDKKGEDVNVKSDGPISSRVVLRQNSESSCADLRLLNDKLNTNWTDQEALEAEARILLATAPPLCLKPDPNLGRMANTMQRISTPRTPPPLRPQKRKLEATEADERAAARKVKILQYMDPQRNRASKPSTQFWETVASLKSLHKIKGDPQAGAENLEEAAAAEEMSPPTPAATPAPNGAESRPNPTPVKSEVARSTTGTPVPVPSARATPQVAAVAAAQAAARQITPRPASTVPNPAVAAYAASQVQATQAAQAVHAAAMSRPASQAPPAQPQTLPPGMTQQQFMNIQNQARQNIHNSMRARAPTLQNIATKRSRGENLTADEEKLFVYFLQVQKAEKCLTDANSTNDPSVKAELQKQYYQILGPLIAGQVKMLMHGRTMQAQAAQAQQGQGHGQAQAPNQPPVQPPAPAPSATPVMPHNQAQSHAAQTQVQALQAQGQLLAQAHAAAQAQAQAQANGHPHGQTPQEQQAYTQAMYQQRIMHHQQQQQHQHQAAAAAMLANHGTPAQAHAQLPMPNGASPMFAARQPVVAAPPRASPAHPTAQLNQAQVQAQLQQMMQSSDPRMRAYGQQLVQGGPQAVQWFSAQQQQRYAMAAQAVQAQAQARQPGAGR